MLPDVFVIFLIIPTTSGAYDETHNGGYDTYITKFSLAPMLSLTSPNGGEEWVFGTTHDITWTSDNVGDIQLVYSTDGGANWTIIDTGVDALSGNYEWTVPEIISSNCIVRIFSVDEINISDYSDGIFSITNLPKPEISLATVTVELGEVDVGSSTSGSFVISNDGNEILEVSSISNSNALFTVTPAFVIVESEADTTITVTFNPVKQGLQTAIISIVSNDTDEETVTVEIKGTGVAPEITISADSLFIEDVSVDSTKTVPLELTNVGNKTLEVSEIQVDNEKFTVDFVSSFIEPGESDTVYVSFTPVKMGIETAVISIVSSDGTHEVYVHGTSEVPEIVTTELLDATEDILYEVSIQIEKNDYDVECFFELGGGPGWLKIDTETGVLAGTPSNEDVGGSNLVNVRIYGDDGVFDRVWLPINVINVNDPPVIKTTSLPDAVIDELYLVSLDITDPDKNDSTTVNLIIAPLWLTIDENNNLTGSPYTTDIGLSRPVRIQVVDSGGLADTLLTSVSVLNLNVVPEIVTQTLSNARVGKAYIDSIKVVYPETGGDLTFSIVDGPDWLSIDSSGLLSGTPQTGDDGSDIPATIWVTNGIGNRDILQTSINVLEAAPVTTFFSFDLDFQDTGFQGGPSVIYNPGAGQLFGFAIYIRENINLKGFTVDLTWDSTKAEFRKSKSGPAIGDDILDINGQTNVTLAEEVNILESDSTGSLFSIVGKDEAGRYTVSWAKIGGESVTESDGLLYMAVFKTASDISINDLMTVKVGITVSDGEGFERDLGDKEFMVGAGIDPPTNVKVTDVPGDFGNRLQLTWTLSADDDLVLYYYVYRSRNPYFSDPLDLDSFTSIEELIEAEKNRTLIVGKVPGGQNSFVDDCIVLNGVQYYYWLQAVSEIGTSEKMAGDMFITQVELYPTDFKLYAPYPNPFNPSTTIDFYLPGDMHVALFVINVSGQQVAVLEDNVMSAGNHSVVWDALDMPSGLYFITMKAGEYVESNKVLLMK